MGWTSTNNELPKAVGTYLVAAKLRINEDSRAASRKYVSIAIYDPRNPGLWRNADSGALILVTDWDYLPLPPE